MKQAAVPTLKNVHKLLRIVWVYVENCKCKEKIQQGILPKELAKELVDKADLENMYSEANLPETEVYAALEKLVSIFHDVYEKTEDERFQAPPDWEKTNPCQDARPRFRH